ncbi:MAG: alpha/beta hydrolase [Bacteroidia bacterium]
MKNTFAYKYLIIVPLCIFCVACFKLDSNLFNSRTDITTYLFDAYTDEQDFKLDSSYNIDSVYSFDVFSKTAQETSPTRIKACLIGFKHKLKTDTVILYCHGNKWHMDFYWQRAKLLAHINGKCRYPVLFFDYRGFGLSEGQSSETAMYADTRACLQWLKDQGVVSNRLILYGFSLGSAPATEICSHVTDNPISPSKLILEAPFGSSEIMVKDASRINLPASYFTNLKIDNCEEIKNVSIPLLWTHGTSDMFLNYKTHGEVVYNNKHYGYKTKYLVENAGHDNIPNTMGFDFYLREIGKFIRMDVK